nr:unnamed protein product [Callosobruchus analis]
MWDESIGGRGGNEMSSCLMKYASSLPNGVDHIVVWSDNCPSQNRNLQIIMCYFLILQLNPSIKQIEHKYLLRGHTHMEVDSVHARIEKALKNSPKFSIITPWDWQQLIRICDHRIDVFEMDTTDFLDFNQHNAEALLKPNKKKIKVNKVVHMKFLKGSNGILYYKISFDQTEFDKIDFNKPQARKTRREQEDRSQLSSPGSIRESLKPITSKKFADLQEALKWVPKRFYSFFNNLSHGIIDEVDEDT